jgi:hypothetical protein
VRNVPSTSAIVNRALRMRVTPLLRKVGFDKVEARRAWLWRPNLVWVFTIRAIGGNLGDRIWPPSSVNVLLGIYYRFFPQIPPHVSTRKATLQTDRQGRPQPAADVCHMCAHLECGLDQSKRTQDSPNRAEQKRRDIWWVDPDGANADEVASDIAISLFEYGVPWYERASNLKEALAIVESERDSFSKFSRAFLLAREIGDRAHEQRFVELARNEACRIRQSSDPADWYLIPVIPRPASAV